VFFAWDGLLGPTDEPSRRRRRVFLYLPLFALTLAAGLTRLYVFFRFEHNGSRPLWQQALTQAGGGWRYFALLVFTVGQSVSHAVPLVSGPGDPVAWAAVAGLAALGLLVVRLVRAEPLLLFGVAWFVLLVAPSAVVPLRDPMAEHRIYAASPGLF